MHLEPHGRGILHIHARRDEEREVQVLKDEIVQLRLALAEREHQAAHAERLKTLGETAAALAHEVKNPLGSLKLFVSLLQDGVQEPSHVEIVHHVMKSVDNLTNVVDNILLFAKGRALPLAPVNIHSLLHEQVELLGPRLYGPKIEVSFEGNPYIQGNEHSLRRVFQNLLINAAQATSFEGQIWVTCTGSPDEVEIRIRDAGPGIDLEAMDTIFEPFMTTRVEGTGLGLAIVREIVDRHEGEVYAVNKGGAEFVVVLPRIQS